MTNKIKELEKEEKKFKEDWEKKIKRNKENLQKEE